MNSDITDKIKDMVVELDLLRLRKQDFEKWILHCMESLLKEQKENCWNYYNDNWQEINDGNINNFNEAYDVVGKYVINKYKFTF